MKSANPGGVTRCQSINECDIVSETFKKPCTQQGFQHLFLASGLLSSPYLHKRLMQTIYLETKERHLLQESHQTFQSKRER